MSQADDPEPQYRVLELDADTRAAYGLPPTGEIRVLGEPILAWNAPTNNTTVPPRFARHVLIGDRYFFTLPRPLWDEVYHQIGSAAFDAESVDLEYALSEINGDHSERVGFWRGMPISYAQLRRPDPMQVSAEEAQSVGWNVKQATLDNVMRIANQRTNEIARTTRGYVGWLLVNRQFLDEHDSLLTQWTSMVQRWGLERLGQPHIPGFALHRNDPAVDEQWPSYRSAFAEFFRRWRLQGLAAPYLPVPRQPLLSGSIPGTMLPQLQGSPGLFFQPDTFPVSSRDSLRGMLDDALHGSPPPEHLTEWRNVIASDNQARHTLVRFSRLFVLQHYWRVLQSRYQHSLRRKTTTLKSILASFLETSQRTIDLDFVEVRRRLGSEWTDRGHSWPFGPF